MAKKSPPIPDVHVSFSHICEQLYLAQDKNCFHCGEFMTPYRYLNHPSAYHRHPKGWTREHMIPYSKGGPNSWKNMTLAHYSCNRERGTRELTEEEIARWEIIKSKVNFSAYRSAKSKVELIDLDQDGVSIYATPAFKERVLELRMKKKKVKAKRAKIKRSSDRHAQRMDSFRNPKS